MFDRIAHRYDLLNHLLSANRDLFWRRQLAGMLPRRSTGLTILDLGTGTADQLLTFYDSGDVKSGVGLDLSEQMLSIGRRKVAARGLSGPVRLLVGDAEAIPFADSCFDVVSMSFGIRNVTDVRQTLREIHRVLNQGGRTLVLEFSLPSNRVISRAYLFYLRHILPRLGSLIAGDDAAYSYLNETIETFPYGDDFCSMMSEAGFADVTARTLTKGIATIYRGDKA